MFLITLLARDEWVAAAGRDAALLCSFVFARVRCRAWRSHLISSIIIHTVHKEVEDKWQQRALSWEEWAFLCIINKTLVAKIMYRCVSAVPSSLPNKISAFLQTWDNWLSLKSEGKVKANEKMRAVFYWGWSLGLISIELNVSVVRVCSAQASFSPRMKSTP